jgi:hypothetical protein
MKINFPTEFLALIGILTIAYFTLRTHPEQTGTEKKILVEASSSKLDLRILKSIKNTQVKQVWQPSTQQQRPKMLPENLHVEYIQVANNSFKNLSEGQKISFLIPQENKSYIGIIKESTHAFGNKVKMSAGDIENGNKFASFSITEGKNTTFVTVATGESIYQVEIDHQSGIGTVMDDRELSQYRYSEDGILPPPEGIS